MRLISQDGTFDVPYDQVVIQRYSDGIYWLNKNLIGVESGISEDFKIASYSSEVKAIKAMEMVRKSYVGFPYEDKVIDGKELKEEMRESVLTVRNDGPTFEINYYFQFPKDEEVQE